MSITRAIYQAWVNRLAEIFPCLEGCEFSILQILIGNCPKSRFVLSIKPDTHQAHEAIGQKLGAIRDQAQGLDATFILLSLGSDFDLMAWGQQVSEVLKKEVIQ